MGLIYDKIPRAALGRPLLERDIKAGLRHLNWDICFDPAGRHNEVHPDIDYSQGVYLSAPDGLRHLGTLDRGWMLGGVIPEHPIWSMSPQVVTEKMADTPVSVLMQQPELYPLPCMHDPTMWTVLKPMPQDLICCGWRDTFNAIVRKNVPGITYAALCARFKIDFVQPNTEHGVDGEQALPWDRDRTGEKEEGKILDEMGAYQARPTVVLTDAEWKR